MSNTFRIKDYFSVYNGATPSSSNAEFWDGDIAWISPADMREFGEISCGEKSITQAGYNSCGTTIVPPGSIIISSRAPIGKVSITSAPLCTNQGCKSLVPKNINVKYVAYYLFNSAKELDMLGCGTTFKELATKKLTAFRIVVPDKVQQEKIVSFLDARTAEIDAMVSLLKEKKGKYLELKESVINEAVTKGLDTQCKFKDTDIKWINKIPNTWTTKRMKDIFIESKSVSVKGEEDLLSVSEYYGVAKRSEKMADDEMYESRADSLVGYKICHPGDLVINIMLAWKTGLGISDYHGIVSPAYAVYKGKGIVPHYYHYLLRTNMYVTQFKRNSKGIIDSRLRMYTDRFNNIPAIYPPIEEQQAIADYLDERCAKIDSAIEIIDKQIAKYTELKKSLINEVITGKRVI